MSAPRLFIASVLFLAVGLGLVIAYCSGSMGFAAGYPISATSIHVDITTSGLPAIAGCALTLLGVVLQIAAFFGTIFSRVKEVQMTAKSAMTPQE